MRPPWMGRNLTIIMAARIPMSGGRAIAGVVVPIYLAQAGYGALALGALFAVVAATSALLSTAIGIASDRWGRKAFMVAVPILTAGCAVALALTLDPVVVFLAASLGSFGRGGGAGGGTVGPYRPAEQALTGDSVAPSHRTPAFARLNFASSAGAVVGSLLIGPLAHSVPRGQVLQGYRPEFLVIAAGSTLAGLMALWLVEAKRRSSGDGPALPLLPRRSRGLLYRLWVVNGLNGIGVGMFGPFLAYWLYRRYGVGPGSVGDLYAVVNGATLVANLGAAPLANWFGLVRATFWFRVLQGLLLIPMVLSPTFVLAGAVYLVRMLCQRVALPLRQSYAMGVSDPAERGAVAAWSEVPSQVLGAGAPSLAGALFSDSLLALPFIVGGALQVLSALAFYLFFRGRPPAEERTTPAAPASESTTLT